MLPRPPRPTRHVTLPPYPPLCRRRRWRRWWNGSLAGFALLVPVALGYGYDLGNGAGNASGYARARDEVAAASWAHTVNGKLARRIDQASEQTIPAIAACPKDHGWKREKRDGAYWCFGANPAATTRSEARRVGQEGVSTCRSRRSPAHSKKQTKKTHK